MTTPIIGFLPIARPTFDVPLAQEKTQQAYQALQAAGYQCTGSEQLIMNTDDLAGVIELFQQNPVDLLLLFQASFADSTMAQQLARAIDAPLLLWAIPEERVGGRLRLNSFCGINLAGHGLRRDGIHYDYIYADPDDPAALEKLATIAKAAQVRRQLQTVRIGRVGEHPAGFDTCKYDADLLQHHLGVEVVQVELDQVFEQVRQADPAAVAAVAERVSTQISGLDQVDATATAGTLGTYLTLQDLARQKQLHGMAIRCWGEFFTELGCAACGAMSMMTNEAIPCSCEADVNGTLTQFILQAISGQAAFGTDIVSFDLAEDVTIVWHCGLAPLSMADPDVQPRAALHSNRQKPLLMEFPLKPGRITVARLSEATGGYRLVIGAGEVIKAPPGFTGTSGTVRFDSGAGAVMDTIMSEGLEHHIALTYGDHVDVLMALARMLNLPVLKL